VPDSIDLERWLVTFPSFGYLLSVSPQNVPDVLARFTARDITAASIGQIKAGSEVAIVGQGARALIRDHASEPLLRMGRLEEAA
jgi:selenophosphate synthetase-related protein